MTTHRLLPDPAASSPDMAALNVVSKVLRAEKAAIRRGLRFGDIRACDVFLDPPACLDKAPVFDVLRMAPGVGEWRLILLGRAAVRDGVNLALPMGRTSARTRAWVAERVL